MPLLPASSAVTPPKAYMRTATSGDAVIRFTSSTVPSSSWVRTTPAGPCAASPAGAVVGAAGRTRSTACGSPRGAVSAGSITVVSSRSSARYRCATARTCSGVTCSTRSRYVSVKCGSPVVR